MPTYDFKCKKCGEKFSIKVSIKEKENVTCPKCGKKEMQQLFSSFSFVTSKGGNCDSPTGSPFT